MQDIYIIWFSDLSKGLEGTPQAEGEVHFSPSAFTIQHVSINYKDIQKYEKATVGVKSKAPVYFAKLHGKDGQTYSILYKSLKGILPSTSMWYSRVNKMAGTFLETLGKSMAGQSQPQPLPSPSHSQGSTQPASDRVTPQALEKLSKLVQVSDSLKISQMARILGISEDSLLDKIPEWALEYGFRIDQDTIRFSQDKTKTSDFVQELEREFKTWGNSSEKA